MPNSLQSSAIGSPASRRATNCSLSSITEHSFQGIHFLLKKGESVTYVSGTMCYLCLRPQIYNSAGVVPSSLTITRTSSAGAFAYFDQAEMLDQFPNRGLLQPHV